MTPDVRPTLYRVVVIALVLGLAVNVLLWWVAADDDYFAEIIAVASGISAVAIVVSHLHRRLRRWSEEALLLAFAVWTANTIEFALETGVPWENRTRQCGLYTAEAILALGAYIAVRLTRERTN